MRFACLIYMDEQATTAMPEPVISRMETACHAYANMLAERKAGHVRVKLMDTDSATVVRVRGGRTTVGDVDCQRGDAQLTGFYLMEAASMPEALALASGIPEAAVGCIEVRPMAEIVVTSSPRNAGRLIVAVGPMTGGT